jgi:hypothetical protein
MPFFDIRYSGFYIQYSLTKNTCKAENLFSIKLTAVRTTINAHRDFKRCPNPQFVRMLSIGESGLPVWALSSNAVVVLAGEICSKPLKLTLSGRAIHLDAP